MSNRNYTIQGISGKAALSYVAWILGFLLLILIMTIGINYIAGFLIIKSLLTKISFLVPILGFVLVLFALTVLIQRPQTGEIVLPFIKKVSAKRELELKFLQKVLLGIAMGLLILIHL
jgi:hypothetical protein